MSAPLQIIRLRPEHSEALSRLFASIATDEPAERFFHPHPFDASTAERICGTSGRDLYAALEVAGRFEGYGILRGWDEGFAIPSLGIYVSPALRGSGAARMLMEHLHIAARLAAAPAIRLKVYPENVAALRLYRSLGYDFEDRTDASGQYVGRLTLAG